MSAPARTTAAAPPAPSAWGDALQVAKRNLTRLLRVPDSIVFGILQSVMFVLLFAYVFGGAIEVPGGSYVDFLMGGIFVQTVAFTAATTTVAMAEDLQRGIIDRFRSLPMARSAVLTGRTVSDLAFSGITMVAMIITGLLVGWRTNSSFLEVVAALLLLFLFGYAFPDCAICRKRELRINIGAGNPVGVYASCRRAEYKLCLHPPGYRIHGLFGHDGVCRYDRRTRAMHPGDRHRQG